MMCLQAGCFGKRTAGLDKLIQLIHEGSVWLLVFIQPGRKHTPDPSHLLCEALSADQMSRLGCALVGWNENLQPHGPLMDQFDQPWSTGVKWFGVST